MFYHRFFPLFFFTAPATTEIYTLSLHDALPICQVEGSVYMGIGEAVMEAQVFRKTRSEEHTSELQSHSDLVCRLLLEKKKNTSRPAHSGRSAAACAPPAQC